MHLLALTKRSAFYIEEKRHIEERHISPVHLIVLHLPAKEVAARSQTPSLLSKASAWRRHTGSACSQSEMRTLMPVKDGPVRKGARYSLGQVSKGDDNQMYDVITSVTLLRFGISCKYSMQA